MTATPYIIIATLFFWSCGSFASDFVFFLDFPQKTKVQIQEDVQRFEKMEFSGSLPLFKELFGGGSGTDILKYFKTKIRHFGVSKCGGGAVYACAEPLFASQTIWVTKKYIDADLPQIYRMMILLHESRHTHHQNVGWPHQDCPTNMTHPDGSPILETDGQPMAGREHYCDENEYGSYGMGNIFLANVGLYCTNCPAEERQYALSKAKQLTLRIANPASRQRILNEISEAEGR